MKDTHTDAHNEEKDCSIQIGMQDIQYVSRCGCKNNNVYLVRLALNKKHSFTKPADKL